ncbi:MAG: hypothetical protein H0T79_13440, partial [Deltaproteobacteria bacterium]|nr:hypothetical protein [Deltaproteobacteria bacterium]
MQSPVLNAVRHVLLVDAIPEAVADAREALAGMDVEAVTSPPAALDRVVSSPFDVVLLDP